MSINLKIGVLGIPGGWSSETMADALKMRTGFRLIADPEMLAYEGGSGTLTVGGCDLSQLDGLVLRKIGTRYAPCMLDRLSLLSVLRARGVRMFSEPEAIAGVLDRVACTMGLQMAGVPMPPTTITEDPEVAAASIATYRTAVLKPLFSTKARGMLVVRGDEDVTEALRMFRAAGNPIYYVQKLLDLPGRDLGVVFMGGEYVGAYARQASPESWNTTVHSGGSYRPYDPSPEVMEVAVAAQAPFGLDYTTVDVVETGDGPLVLEVSAFGGFRGLFSSQSMNAAQKLADYVIGRINGG